MAADNYWDGWLQRRARRRRVLAGGSAAAVGMAGLALVGCGDDDDNTKTTASPATGGGASPSASAASSAPVKGGTLRFPLSGASSANPPTIFPFENLTYLAQTPSASHYSRLLRGTGGPNIGVNDNTAMEGDLAAKMPEQPDPKTYIFTMKPNVKWHDKAPLNGRAATAQDFVKTYDAFLKVSQNAAGWKAVVDKITAPDEKTIRIDLTAPYAPFLITHASSAEAMWFIPAETIDNDQAKKDPVGTGPFIFEKYESGVAISWKRNPTYYDAPYPYFDRVEAGLINDPQRLVAALQAGEYDLSGLNGPIYKESRSKFDSKGQEFFPQSLSQGAFYFNFDNKPWNDLRVRQALSLALDRDGYLKVQDGTGKGNYFSFIPPGLAPFYLSPRDNNKDFGAQGKYWIRDVKAARDLLKAATGSDTLKFKLFCNVDRYGAEAQQAWELFASTLKEAGFEAELVYQEYGGYIQSTYLGKMPEGGCACGPLIGSPRDPDNMFQNYWSESPRHNWGGTPIEQQKDLDAMIVKQRTILDNKERLKYIQDMQVKMTEFFQTVPYHASGGYVYSQPWMKNFFYKAGYAYMPDGLMKANFTEERAKKG
jgi:ABC-type transport system substrate-binding protein